MYVRVAPDNPPRFYQGDIIDDFPFFIFTDTYNLLERVGSDGQYEIRKTSLLPKQPEIITALPIRPHRAILLSQTCDIQSTPTVIIAPVYSLAELTADGRLSANNVNLVRKRRGAMKEWFYLPALDGVIEESFVDFSTLHYFPKTLMAPHLEKRVVGLSDWGRHLLDWALGDYLGRPIENKYRL